MRKFITSFFIFTIIVLVLNILLLCIAYILLNTASFKLKETKKVLVLGDSTTECAIDDKNYPFFENVSQSGTAYIYTYAKLQHFIQQNSNIKLVILSVHAGTLTADDWVYSSASLNEKVPEYFFLFDEQESAVLDGQSAFYSGILKMPLTQLKAISKKMSGRKITFKDLRIGKFREHIGSHLDLNQKSIHCRPIDVTKFSKAQLDFLYKSISLCVQKNIRVILLTTPMFNTKPNKSLAEYLSEKFPNVIYWDFSDMKLNKTDYYDVDHLNNSGAKVFTFILKGRLNLFLEKNQ